MTNPNDSVVRLGVMLVNQVALDYANALVHLRNEKCAAAWPNRGESAGGSSTMANNTQTGALARVDFGHELDDLADALYGAEVAVKHLARTARDALGKIAPPSTDQKRCGDGQVGRDAPLWSDDLKCLALADKLGLCSRHYSAYRRYRVDHGRDTTGDFEATG